LLNNASKYSPEESDVEVDVSVNGGWLVVEVKDRGPGVPEENPAGLFEMFHRADNATSSGDGDWPPRFEKNYRRARW